MPLTYSIANGVVAGMVAFVIIELFTTPLLTKPLFDCVRRLKGGAHSANDLHEPLHGPVLSADNRSISASSSPHAMVRPPSLTNRPSFNGLAALGGKGSPPSSPSASGYVAPSNAGPRALYPNID